MTTDPTFFYSTVPDTCNYDGQDFPATNNTENGDLCAYIPHGNNAPLIWACPAPDSVCWSWEKQCTGTNSTTPGPNQIACSNDSSDTWCCNGDYEECTQTSGQINICWAKTFKNPNAGVPPSAAASIASSMVAASQTSALNSRLSAISATASTSKSYSSSASVTATPGHNNGATESISGSAIAGIVIAGIVGIALIVAAVLFWLRRRRTHQPIPEVPNDTELFEAAGHPIAYGYYKDSSKSGDHTLYSRGGLPAPIELAPQTIPAELPAAYRDR